MKESNHLEVRKLVQLLVLKTKKLDSTIFYACIYNPLFHNAPAHEGVSKPHVCLSMVVVFTSAVCQVFLAPALQTQGLHFLVPGDWVGPQD